MVWTLAVTQPLRELKTARRLDEHHFSVFLPKIIRRLCVRGRLVDRPFPAYPRYLWLEAQQRYHELKSIYGIADFIKTGDIVDRSVMALMAASDPQGVLPVPEPEARFEAGDYVLIRGNGVLAGQFALYDRPLGDGKSMVMIDWLGRYCPVAIPDDDLLERPKVAPKPASRKRRRRRRRHMGRTNAGPTARAN